MNTTDELLRLLDEFEHECYMLRVEASETRAKDEVVREAYERIREESARAIAATLGGDECELTMDGTDGCFGCSECLENIPPLANFCPNCGKRIQKVVKR